MKKKIIISSSIILLTIFLLFISLYFYLPNQIKIIEGNEEKVSFGFPFRIKINGKLNEIEVKSINASYDYIIKGKEVGKQKITTMIGFIPIRKVDVDVVAKKKIIPVGKVAGIRIYENGAIVLGIDKKLNYNTKEETLKSGDVIVEINNVKIKNKHTIVNEVNKSKGQEIKLKILRENEHKDINIVPKLNDVDGKYKLGVWVRDSTQGIGTITYINPEKNTLGMLGHPIIDVDTGSSFNVRKGKVLEADVTYVKKGEKGTPGEIMGSIYDSNNSEIANIIANTNYGLIASCIKEVDFEKDNLCEVATINEVKLGKAYILSNILDDIVKPYEIEVEEISKYGYAINKGMIIKVKDEELISKTGGIVQGMSGSPIIQNDKVIGAVTHVFIQNPQKGFAIFIEDMLENDKLIQ